MRSYRELEHSLLVCLVLEGETAIEDEVVEHLVHGNNTASLLGNAPHF